MCVVEGRVAAWLLLLGVLAVGVGATPDERTVLDLVSNGASNDGDDGHPPMEMAIGSDEKARDVGEMDPSADDKKSKFFFGSFQTMTHIIVTYDTTTVPLFCLSGTAAAACTGGRRKRQALPSVLRAAEKFGSELIEGSQNLESATNSVPGDLESGGKKFFTVWTKVLTTTTLTSTTTNTASTITLSYYCTAGSLSIPPLCG